MRAVLTNAERERERKLRDDPLVAIINSAHVECKQCGRKIKLSSKMAFDPLHWRNHRARCVKRQKKKRGAAHSMMRQSSTTDDFEVLHSPLTSPPPSPSRPQVHIGRTLDPASDVSSSTTASPPPTSPSSIRHHPEVVEITQTNENGKTIIYFVPRPYRPPTPTSGVLGPSEGWKTWSWSQLKLPDFEATALHLAEQSLDGYGGAYAQDHGVESLDDSVEARQRREAAISLSLLAQSPSVMHDRRRPTRPTRS